MGQHHRSTAKANKLRDHVGSTIHGGLGHIRLLKERLQRRPHAHNSNGSHFPPSAGARFANFRPEIRETVPKTAPVWLRTATPSQALVRVAYVSPAGGSPDPHAPMQ